MKVRSGWVSNSSSASFTIALDKLTTEQLIKLSNYEKVAREMGMEFSDEDFYRWRFSLEDGNLEAYASERWNAVNMKEFLERIGVPRGVVDSYGC
jgi:hypothetical protein